VTGFPLLTRSPDREVHSQVAIKGDRLTVTVPHHNVYDEMSAFQLVPATGHARGTRLAWRAPLRWEHGAYRGTVGDDRTNPLVVWYAHGVRHFYGEIDTGTTSIYLVETFSGYAKPSLLGGFPFGSFVALYGLLMVALTVLFRPDALGLRVRRATPVGIAAPRTLAVESAGLES
jgi:hypothetical protein